MRAKKTIALAVAVGLSATLGACGKKPEEKVQQTIEKQSTATSISAKGHLETTPETWLAFLKDFSKDKKEFTASDEKLTRELLNTSFTYEAATTNGKPLSQATEADPQNMGIFVDNGDKNIFSFLVMDKQLFLKGAVRDLATMTDMATPRQLDAIKESANSKVASALIDGQWLGLDEKLSKDFEKSLTEKAAEKTNQNPAEQKQTLQKAREAFMKNSTFKEEGDWVVAETKVKPMLNELNTSKGEAGAKKLEALRDDAVVKVHMKYDGEVLKQAKFNLAEVGGAFDEGKLEAQDQDDARMVRALKSHPMDMVFDFAEAPQRLTAPTDATQVSEQDLQQLGGLMMGAAMMMSSGSQNGATPQ